MQNKKSVRRGNYTAFGYQAAQYARANSPASVLASPDYHVRYDREKLIAESQRLYRDNSIYKGILDRATENIIGSGFQLQARTNDPALNDKIETLWDEFCLEPEVRGEFTFAELERIVLRNKWIDGDILLIKTNTGKLQIIESARIWHPQKKNGENIIELGVEQNYLGQHIRFYIVNYNTGGMLLKNSGKAYDAKDCIFLANIDGPSQTRGVPKLTAALPNIHMLQDILTSEAISWQLQSRYGIAVTVENAEAYRENYNTDDTAKENEEQIPGRFQEIDAGIIFYGKQGEAVAPIKREIPAQNFPEAVRLYLRLIGLPVGLPLELILLDFVGLNLSSARASLMQAHKSFQTEQESLKRKLHRNVFNWKVEQWVNEGLLPNIPDVYKCEWVAPQFIWFDPLKDAAAIGEKLDRGLTNLTLSNAAQGLDTESIRFGRKKEILDAIKDADEINQAYPGSNVDWRVLAGIKVQNVSGSSGENATNDKQNEGSNKESNGEDDEVSDSNDQNNND